VDPLNRDQVIMMNGVQRLAPLPVATASSGFEVSVTNTSLDIWAAIPDKDMQGAKQRLSPVVPRHLLEGLVLAMFEDVIAAVSCARGLAGVAVITADPLVARLAESYGARILTTDARGGHTAAVATAARSLADEGVGGMMQLPGDIPLVTADEISQVLALHRRPPSFTIVPSHDDFGSNAIVVSPPTAVPLTFGDNSFFPHLKAAERHGISPLILRVPGISRDIDNPEDLCAFAGIISSTRTKAYLDENDVTNWHVPSDVILRAGARG
jgi:2-phospho-L-lactate/phosphoenolpyruvate guanylyltransferase